MSLCLEDQQKNGRSKNSLEELREEITTSLDVSYDKIALLTKQAKNILDILRKPDFDQKQLDKALVSLNQFSKQLTDLRQELESELQKFPL